MIDYCMTGGHLTTCVICYFYLNRQGNIQKISFEKIKQWEYTGSENYIYCLPGKPKVRPQQPNWLDGYVTRLLTSC